MKINKHWPLMCVLFAGCIGQVHAKQILLNNDPVEIKLAVNQEVRVEFPDAVIDLNIPAELDDKVETFLKPNGTIYWTAKESIKPQRVIATTAGGEVVLIDVIPKDHLTKDDLVVKLVDGQSLEATVVYPQNFDDDAPSETAPSSGLPPFLASDLEVESQVSQPQKRKVSYADMAAFALRHYFGPERLIGDLPATRVKAKTPSGRFIRVWGSRVNLSILNSWTYEGQYITAVKVSNRSNTRIPFDPRSFRGNFKFAASLHETLEPRGGMNDTTVMVFITDEPFYEAVGG